MGVFCYISSYKTNNRINHKTISTTIMEDAALRKL